jgi:hypothetical protein
MERLAEGRIVAVTVEKANFVKGASLWIGRVFEFKMFFGGWERLSVFS